MGQTVEKVIEVPQVQPVERAMPVPQVQIQEVVVPVPRVVTQEVVRQMPVPQVATVEKIAEVTEVMAPPPWQLLSVQSEAMERPSSRPLRPQLGPPRSGLPRSGLPRSGATQVLSVPLMVLHPQSSEHAKRLLKC